MLFNLCAVPPNAPPDYWMATARLIGLTGFSVILLCCMPGGIVYFFYKPSGETRHDYARVIDFRNGSTDGVANNKRLERVTAEDDGQPVLAGPA